MRTNRLVHVFEDRTILVNTVADQFIAVITEAFGALSAHDAHDAHDTVNIVLTGGTVGTEILAAIGVDRRQTQVDWKRVHVWWGDERWLPAGDPERNDTQAAAALLSRVPIPTENIHRFPAEDGPFDLGAAADAYARELADHSPGSGGAPRFDLLFLGVGPDGHIASLFPGREGIREKTSTAIAVRNSPKPPPERLSLTLSMINSAERVWLCLAGADKASALGLTLAGASVPEVPAAGAEGRLETVFFVDQAAASEVPPELLDSN